MPTFGTLVELSVGVEELGLEDARGNAWSQQRRYRRGRIVRSWWSK